MVPTIEMFSPVRHQQSPAAYGAYGHQYATQYSEQYPDSGNYAQNFHNSWSLYAVNPSRQHVLVEDWMNSCNYQGQEQQQFQQQQQQFRSQDAHMRVVQESKSGTENLVENPSSDSVVAVSSDGLSGSESPCLQSGAPGGGLFRPQPARSPFEWIRRTSCPPTAQPNPGRTRTKDKYRIVYSDHQRLELEKEYHYSHYITIRRKVELATLLNLSERQIKIWFQNRRAKERRQAKKREEIMQKNKDTTIMYQQTPNLNIANMGLY